MNEWMKLGKLNASRQFYNYEYIWRYSNLFPCFHSAGNRLEPKEHHPIYDSTRNFFNGLSRRQRPFSFRTPINQTSPLLLPSGSEKANKDYEVKRGFSLFYLHSLHRPNEKAVVPIESESVNRGESWKISSSCVKRPVKRDRVNHEYSGSVNDLWIWLHGFFRTRILQFATKKTLKLRTFLLRVR